MLVIANGAFKSGSTWLFNIVRELAPFASPPDIYLNPHWIDPSIAPDKLRDFIEHGDYAHRDYLVKNHLGRRWQVGLLCDRPHAQVLNIERDLRDVVVSAYYHHQRRGVEYADFSDFYWVHGRYIADAVNRYQQRWRNTPATNIFFTSYQALHDDLEREVARLAEFLALDLSAAKVGEVRQQTSLDSLRQRYRGTPYGGDQEGQQFFRQGETGSWREYFDPRMLSDLSVVSSRGIGQFGRGLGIVTRKRRGLPGL